MSWYQAEGRNSKVGIDRYSSFKLVDKIFSVVKSAMMRLRAVLASILYYAATMVYASAATVAAAICARRAES